MKIAITADPGLPVPPRLYGGIERIIHMLVEGLADRGHDVTLFAHEDSEVPCRLVPYGGTDPQAVIDTVRNALSVSRLVVDRPDVLHSFGRLAYLTPLLPLRLPKIMTYQREPTLSRVQTAVRLSRKRSIAFTGCSDHIAKQIRPYAPAYTVYNGVPLDTYTFRPDVEADAPLVFLGRIAPIKGTHTAVEVAQRSGRPLVIAGNVPDDQQDFFDKQIEPHLDGEHIQYVGPVDDEQKNELLGRAAAFLMPIEWEEPFGIVMAEAMACGTPVIGTRRGSVPEVVEHGKTGFVCDSMDDMIDAVGRIDRIDRADCRSHCEEMFSQTAVVDAYERLYETRIEALQPS
ncbi:glycosyltransferase involved in cell wall biosynthesis [Salinibacter ruber]|uniref:glycosyltransferase family 4 protein n=1 Tax=Salinibacter ruber TaxID=146919 RepID=UPI00216A68FF|nr:glycosyltransferase family 4 protein [Salinibacter ruber]MCS3700188.1 glycosyltransferase involved in cell wall biosynthesis [Salinibacter ruber]